MSTGSSAAKPPPPTPITDEDRGDAPPRPLRVKLAWFAALWLGGLLATAALAYALRALLGTP